MCVVGAVPFYRTHIYMAMFKRRMTGRRTARRGARRTSKSARLPRLSKYDSVEVRLEKANFDVRPMLMTTFIQSAVTASTPYIIPTASAAGDCSFSTCPLWNFVASGLNYSNL